MFVRLPSINVDSRPQKLRGAVVVSGVAREVQRCGAFRGRPRRVCSLGGTTITEKTGEITDKTYEILRVHNETR